MKQLTFHRYLLGLVFFVGAFSLHAQNQKGDQDEIIQLSNCPTQKIGMYETEKVIIYFESDRYKNALIKELDRVKAELEKKPSDYYMEQKGLFEERLNNSFNTLMASDTMNIERYESEWTRERFFWHDLYFVLQMLDESQACIYNKQKGRYESEVIRRTELNSKVQKYLLDDKTVIVTRSLKF